MASCSCFSGTHEHKIHASMYFMFICPLTHIIFSLRDNIKEITKKFKRICIVKKGFSAYNSKKKKGFSAISGKEIMGFSANPF